MSRQGNAPDPVPVRRPRHRIVRSIDSTDSCERLVRSLHGPVKRSGIWSHEWRDPAGRLVARSRFNRKRLTNDLEVAPQGATLEDVP